MAAPRVASAMLKRTVEFEHPPVARVFNRRRTIRLVLMLGGILAALAVAATLWLRSGRWVSADDAYVRAGKLMVTTDVSGIVTSIDVHEGQHVKQGQVLFQVDPHQFQIALDNVKAQLAQVALNVEAMKQDYQRMLKDIEAQQAQVQLDQANYDRYAALIRTDVVSKANYDQSRFTLAADKNKLESLKQQAQVQLARLSGNPDLPPEDHPLYRQVKAQVDEAQRQLDHATVRAPFDGIVTQVDSLQRGTYLVSATAALTNTGAVGLVATDRIWVDANLKETDLTHVKPGDRAQISVDSYPGRVWSGTVQSISPGTGSEFSILPAQNASGNWVKVVQRVPVRIRVDQKPGDPVLRAGMSVVVDIDTGHSRSLAELF
jgi:membrane fusion protein (multidrug efflux system)